MMEVDMGVSLKELLARETPAARVKIEARTKDLIAEEMSLRALRMAAGKTQVAVAAQLGLKQENVSRIEQRGDMLLSTLARYLQAVGGNLRLTAEIGGKSVPLAGFAALVGDSLMERRTPVRAAPAKRATASPGPAKVTERPRRRVQARTTQTAN
jgi:transcriptional regulator with XRE-family HTH domain